MLESHVDVGSCTGWFTSIQAPHLRPEKEVEHSPMPLDAETTWETQWKLRAPDHPNFVLCGHVGSNQQMKDSSASPLSDHTTLK